MKNTTAVTMVFVFAAGMAVGAPGEKSRRASMSSVVSRIVAP